MAGDAKFKFGDRVQDVRYGTGFIGAYSPEARLPYLVCFESGKLMWTTSTDIHQAAPTPPPNTVQVRIAVAVESDGQYDAMGCDKWTDEDAMRRVRSDGVVQRFVFITARVPLPEQPAEIQGAVEQEPTDGHH